jgi:hypothetical protein
VCITRLITSLCLGCSGYLLSFTYALIQSLLLSLYLSGGYLPSLSPMAAGLRLLSVFQYSLWWLMQDSSRDILLVSSAYIGVLQTRYETLFVRVLSPVFGSPLLRERLVSSAVTQPTIRCYDLSLWELNNFHCSCFHGSISLNTLQYIHVYTYTRFLHLMKNFFPSQIYFVPPGIVWMVFIIYARILVN